MREITSLMNNYRECSRHLWNAYFSARENIWDVHSDYEDIRKLLFDTLVVNQLHSCDGPGGCETLPRPLLKVVPRTISTPILIKRVSGAGEAGYWDQEKDLAVGPNDIKLAFVDYFEFFIPPMKEFTFYLCKVLSFPAHNEYEGREALIEVRSGLVFLDE